MKNVKPSEIYLCDLDPVIGSEQGGVRPVIVVSHPLCCINSDTVQICPLTTKDKKDIPTHYLLKNYDYSFLSDDSIVLGECVRTISTKRLKYKLGKVDTLTLKEIIECMSRTFYN